MASLRDCRVAWSHMTTRDRLKRNEVEGMIGKRDVDRLRFKACTWGKEGRVCDMGLGICAKRLGRYRWR